MVNLTSEKRLCTFLNDPFDDCYCTKMRSQDIERAVCLCINNFETCKIYNNAKFKAMLMLTATVTSSDTISYTTGFTL
jgi:hypothetical protein